MSVKSTPVFLNFAKLRLKHSLYSQMNNFTAVGKLDSENFQYLGWHGIGYKRENKIPSLEMLHSPSISRDPACDEWNKALKKQTAKGKQQLFDLSTRSALF
jgi:hypothetical protein